MKKVNFNKSIFVATLAIGALIVISFTDSSKSKKISIDYKSSVVSYFGTNSISKADLVKEAKLIDIADRRFETKWKNKDPKGISEEYTVKGSVFMKPGVKPRLGRTDIEKEFTESVKGVDRVEFYQDELEFYGEMDVAFQRCHMLGYVNSKKEHIFEGSYIILWKKENGNWLIQYDMFNSDK
ncbi:nuclear transport factor 2 family protein [Aquimarina sediminis]|uniref:nuclear transport factor 2 family protein n=1 Tax=Aquimarina sediminis TaxID=2070536 RepID=UPI000CA044EE|nr:nuclear transport factor 2 family protein [Aquimarina sediminis]